MDSDRLMFYKDEQKMNFVQNGKVIQSSILINEVDFNEKGVGVIDLLLNVNTKGKHDFTFSADLLVVFSYRFSSGKTDDDVFMVRKDKVCRFQLEARVVNPFDFHLDYQILNPLLRTSNYESNNLTKKFITGEKSLIIFSLENKSNAL